MPADSWADKVLDLAVSEAKDGRPWCLLYDGPEADAMRADTFSHQEDAMEHAHKLMAQPGWPKCIGLLETAGDKHRFVGNWRRVEDTEPSAVH